MQFDQCLQNIKIYIYIYIYIEIQAHKTDVGIKYDK